MNDLYGYTYEYAPTTCQLCTLICEFMINKALQTDKDALTVYYSLSGMLCNAGLEDEFKAWFKRQIDHAISQTLRL